MIEMYNDDVGLISVLPMSRVSDQSTPEEDSHQYV